MKKFWIHECTDGTFETHDEHPLCIHDHVTEVHHLISIYDIPRLMQDLSDKGVSPRHPDINQIVLDKINER